MAETEVFRLDLDTSAIEQKAARVEQIVAQIKQGKGRGEDVSELERSLNKELDGLAQLGQAEKKAAGSTEDLLKQKEKLGAVVRTLGGSFSGMVGDLGGVVELMMSGSSAAIGLGGGMAAMAVGTMVFRKLKEAAKEYADELDRVAEHTRNMRDEMLTLQEQIANTLEKAGIAGASEAVARRAKTLSAQEGIDEELAAFGATAEEVGGLSDAEMRIAMAGYLKTGRTAAFTGDRTKDAAMLEELHRQGATLEAQQFLATRIEETRNLVSARNVMPTDTPDSERQKDMYNQLVKRATRTLGLAPKDVELLGRLRTENLDTEALKHPHFVRKLFPENFDVFPDWTQWAYGGKSAYETIADEKLEGGTQRIEALRGMAERFQGYAARGSTGPRQQEPVVINITDNRNYFGSVTLAGVGRGGVSSIGVSSASRDDHRFPLGGG